MSPDRPREASIPAEDGREPLIRQVADGVHIENQQLAEKLAELRPEWRRHLKLTIAEKIQSGHDSEDAESRVLRQYQDLDPQETAVPIDLDLFEATREEGEIVLRTRASKSFDEIRGYLQSLMD